MSESISYSRRKLMKSLASVPMLPLAASFAASAEARGLRGFFHLPGPPYEHRRGPAVSYSFGSMAAPSLDDPGNMATTYVASTLTRRVGRGPGQTFALAYDTFFLTGDTVPCTDGGSIVAGGYYDIYGQPIRDTSSADQRQFFSDCPDGMSLIQLDGTFSRRRNCDRIFAVVQFEYTSVSVGGEDLYGRLPSPIAVLTLDQDRHTGQLNLVSYHNVDTSRARGLWITCGASRSPWNTHLSSEEYEPDATTIAGNAQFKAFSKNLFGDETAANPYDYGHLPEVFVRPDGTGLVKKHYCLGRISHELIQVMPDERTVIMGDDATNGGLFMFIADRPRDLSAGTLYVAKWSQTSSVGPGAGEISWIRIGHATSRDIKSLVDSGLTAADIMDVRTSDPGDASYTKIRFNNGNSWVKVIPGMEQAAAFLETHRYAALVGGSLAFTKMEGTTLNIADKRAYSAMSAIKQSMTDGTTDIHVPVLNAGAVYEHVLKGGQFDSDGHYIHSEWVSTHMSVPPGLAGADLATPDALGNTANADKIANPDNLKYSEEMRTLFIGEDSGMHVNNFLWAYNVDTKQLSRIMSCPAGAESTGLHAVDDVNGFSYIMSNFQHPGEGLKGAVKAAVDPLLNANYNDKFSAAVGYLAIAGRID